MAFAYTYFFWFSAKWPKNPQNPRKVIKNDISSRYVTRWTPAKVPSKVDNWQVKHPVLDGFAKMAEKHPLPLSLYLTILAILDFWPKWLQLNFIYIDIYIYLILYIYIYIYVILAILAFFDIFAKNGLCVHRFFPRFHENPQNGQESAIKSYVYI